MKKLIVLGSLNMDISIQSDYMPRSGETMNGYGFLMNSGGKGGNQAVAAAKLGVEVKMIANVGNDIFGKQLLDDIETIKEKLEKMTNPGDIFLTQLENDFEVVKKSIQFAKELGLYTILNPAPAKVLDDSFYKYLDLVIVNQSECELLTGIYPEDEKSYRIALAVFHDKGVKAIITLGTDGSITNYTGGYEYITSRKVEAVDTTAAGDSYIGALCRYLIYEKDFVEGLRFASDVAALTVTKKGAQISIPYFNEVKEYFKEDRNYE